MNKKEKKIREELKTILSNYYMDDSMTLIGTVKKIEKLFNDSAK
jgi:hypothetical protein